MLPLSIDAKLVIGVLIASSAVAARAGNNDTNPFHPIVVKNIFKLHDPPLQRIEPETQPLAKITLTGITTILGRPLALFEWSVPGQQQKKNYSTLTIGEADGPIEVLQIDAKAGAVTVKNHGVTMTLTFEQNGAKPASTIQTRELRLPPPPPPPEMPK